MKKQKIKQIIAKLGSIPIEALNDDEMLNDLMVDSFAIIDLSISLQEELNIIFIQEELAQLDTVADLINLIETKWAVTA